MTVRLGGNTAGALNALVPIPASGGGQRPCARGLSIRTSQFPYSTVAVRSSPVDSHDALPMFEAMVDIVLWQSLVRTGGVESEVSIYVWPFCYVRWFGYPLSTPSTIAPESLLERLRSSRGSFRWPILRGVARATPAGVAPEPLEESLTPFLVEMLSTPFPSDGGLLWKGGSGPFFGRFRIGVVTYSRWSERHLPQVELLSGGPSENLCPVRGGQLQPGGVLIKRGRRDRGY